MSGVATDGMVKTDPWTVKASCRISTTGGRPLEGSMPRKAKRSWLVNYMSTQMENSKCMRFTNPSGLTPTNITHSSPGMGSTPYAGCSKKKLILWPEHFSDERAAPS